MSRYHRSVADRVIDSDPDRAGELARRLTEVLEGTRHLSDRADSIDSVYDEVPDLALGLLGGTATVLLVERSGWLVPQRWRGLAEDPPSLPVAGSFVGHVYASGRVLRSGDLPNDPHVDRGRPPPPGVRSAVVTPVTAGDRRVGVITVMHPDPDHFDESDERVLELFATSLGGLVRRVETADQLRAERERLRSLVDATADAAFDWDARDDVFWWSEGVTELFGWPSGSHPGSSGQWEERLHPDDREAMVAETLRFIDDRTTSSWTSQYRFARADGSYAVVVDRSFVLRDDQGAALRVLGGLTDVTASVRAEERSHELQRLESLGQLTSGVAHDLNNLLTVVIGANDQLMDELAHDEDLLTFVEMSRTAALRGAELAHQLLAFGRRQTLEPEAVDVDALVEAVAGLLGRTLPEHVEIHLDLDASGDRAEVDPALLEEAIVDLSVNARDAMPDGGRLTLRTRVLHGGPGRPDVPMGRWVELAVEDTGIGIPTEVLPRVFDPFFTTKAHGDGTGMGLATVHGFVSQTGGHIRISSEPGGGTTVEILLPVVTDDSDATGDAGPNELPDVSSTDRSRRILVVEDDPMVRTMATRFLAGQGFEIEVADSGPAAVELLEGRSRFDLVFSDVSMPGGMTGHDLARVVAERFPHAAVLLTSGYDEAAVTHDRDASAVRSVPLLRKPYRLTDLLDAVRAALARTGPTPPSS